MADEGKNKWVYSVFCLKCDFSIKKMKWILIAVFSSALRQCDPHAQA